MCGIVGYIGDNQAQDVILNGLEKLEYRGYDSAGIAILNSYKIDVAKFKGRLSVLSDFLGENKIEGRIGIGHTRWATHGEPSDENSHPHVNEKNNVAVVHNGIIENYLELKAELAQNGYKFSSQTDTEVIAHLIDFYYDGDLLKTVQKVVHRLKGAFALAIISEKEDNRIIAVRKESPLIIGKGKREHFIASDIPAILDYTNEVYFIENEEIVEVKSDNISIFDFMLNKKDREVKIIDWSIDAASKNGFDHFMIKEIFEQPESIKKTFSTRINEDNQVDIKEIDINEEVLNNINKVYIVACGTAYNAGEIGKYAIEKYAKISVSTDIASEFRYSNPFIDDKTLVILVSQSGETADTLASLRYAKQNGAKILSITNVIGSSIARESDYVLYTYAGPEISVASTKAYTTQIIAFSLLALEFAKKKNTIENDKYERTVEEIKSLPEKIERILENTDNIKKIAKKIRNKRALFYIGRGLDYKVAMEGALKLKEISYIYTESFAAGELKHGTIALIEKDTPVIAISTNEELNDKMLSNIVEVKSRGAIVYSILVEGDNKIIDISDEVVTVPKTIDILQPILSAIPTQFIAYYTSVEKGLDVDKPRNLAKSVTVE